jgi:hypothetical protein
MVWHYFGVSHGNKMIAACTRVLGYRPKYLLKAGPATHVFIAREIAGVVERIDAEPHGVILRRPKEINPGPKLALFELVDHAEGERAWAQAERLVGRPYDVSAVLSQVFPGCQPDLAPSWYCCTEVVAKCWRAMGGAWEEEAKAQKLIPEAIARKLLVMSGCRRMNSTIPLHPGPDSQ